jgi:uncharacterized protein YwgA
MKRLQRAAVILSLIEKLRSEDSWCGETNIQKATYFLTDMMDVPLDFDFILYKHGPYSFDLKEELTALRADSVLELKSPDPRYGPSFFPGKMRDYVMERFPKTIDRYRHKIDFVASRLGEKGVPDLERVATALYVQRERPTLNPEQRASRIVFHKPHIDMEDSRAAGEEVESMILEANNI